MNEHMFLTLTAHLWLGMRIYHCRPCGYISVMAWLLQDGPLLLYLTLHCHLHHRLMHCREAMLPPEVPKEDESTEPPTLRQLSRVAVIKGLPFVAFGFFDNLIMVRNHSPCMVPAPHRNETLHIRAVRRQHVLYQRPQHNLYMLMAPVCWCLTDHGW